MFGMFWETKCILGVVSFGFGCADRHYPGVYTRITKYIDWIGRKTRDSCFCNEHNINQADELSWCVNMSIYKFMRVTNIKTCNILLYK